MMNEEMIGHLASASQILGKGGSIDDLDDDQRTSLIMAHNVSASHKNVPREQWGAVNKDLKLMGSKLKEYAPKIMEAMEKGGTIEKEQDPALFDAINRLHIFGGADTNVNKIMFQGNNVMLQQENKDEKGNTRFGPVTIPNSEHPLVIPAPIFAGTIKAGAQWADYFDQLHMKLGDKAYIAKAQEAERTQKKMSVLLAGNYAVDKLYGEGSKKPSQSEMENAFLKAASEENQRAGGVASVEEIRKVAHEYSVGKVPAVKNENEIELAKRAAKKGEDGKPTPDALEADEALKKLADAKRGEKNPPAPPRRTLMDLRVIAQGKGEEAEAAKKAVKEHESFEMNKEKTKTADAVKKKEAGKPEVSPAERRRRDTEVKSYTEKVMGYFSKDLVVPDEDSKTDVMKRKNAQEYRTYLEDKRAELFDKFMEKVDEIQDEGTNSGKAFEESKKELENRETNLKPITPEIEKQIRAKKPKTRGEAEAMMKKMGYYDPAAKK
jgi:hypothetical protein